MALSKNKARRGEMPEAIKFYFSITSSADTVVYKCFKCNRTSKQRLNTGYTTLYHHLDA
ncbi:hypothetical protein DVH05_020765 [Phytophthora capsici]|nr:hypothetical protein DVH05_020765 [Phytophthora capsici]|eukprot:jgi/Phyca11/107131/e_gw1.13.869.1